MNGLQMMRPGKSLGRLTVATYNIHRWRGLDGRRDPERIAEVMMELDADIIGLQELDYHTYSRARKREFDNILHSTGFTVVHGHTVQQGVGRFGNALLTTHRVLDVRRLNLSVPGREPRGAIDADLEINGEKVQVIVTHLGLRAYERKYQVKRLLQLLPEEPDRMVIMLGDFNEWSTMNSRVRSLYAHLGKCRSMRTFPSACPVLPLDRIWVRPAEHLVDLCVHDSPTARVASDHLPLKAAINIPDGYPSEEVACGFL